MTDMKQILIVDDETIITDALSTIISNQGYAVDTANHGKEACELVSGKHYDLIILDIFMPEMDGIALITELKNMDNQSLLFAISGGGQVLNNYNYLTYAKAMGAAEAFEKPIKSSDLDSSSHGLFLVAEL